MIQVQMSTLTDKTAGQETLGTSQPAGRFTSF